MRSAVSAILLSVWTAAAWAQPTPTKSFSSLLNDGFEIKSTAVGRLVFLQKANVAYVCEYSTLPTDPSVYGTIMSTAKCSQIR